MLLLFEKAMFMHVKGIDKFPMVFQVVFWCAISNILRYMANLKDNMHRFLKQPGNLYCISPEDISLYGLGWVAVLAIFMGSPLHCKSSMWRKSGYRDTRPIVKQACRSS